MGRPRTTEKLINFRISKELSEKLEALQQKLGSDYVVPSRSEVLRLAMERGIDALEAELLSDQLNIQFKPHF